MTFADKFAETRGGEVTLVSLTAAGTDVLAKHRPAAVSHHP